jgi:hypothetical protein
MLNPLGYTHVPLPFSSLSLLKKVIPTIDFRQGPSWLARPGHHVHGSGLLPMRR